MKIGERIRAIRKSRGMTISELALQIDSDVGNISRLERGIQGYTEKTLHKIAKALDTSVSDLFISDNVDNTVNNTSVFSSKGNIGAYMVEILDVDGISFNGKQQGEIAEIIRRIDYSQEEARRIFGGLPQGRVRLINVRGDGMQGTIEPGDLIFIDQGVNFFDGDGIYVFRYEDDIYVKRLQKVKSELLVISDNPRYQQWSLTDDEQKNLIISGRVMLSQSQEMRRHG